ncbi:hypothetical protein E0K83_04020 [Gramella sp. BOM4]|nr:hypothetical protein [Christiangramia bathymodioli]
MNSFRIFVNGIELPHVKDDARIHDENSSFYEEIKVQHSTRPIRIVENEDTLKALGEMEISTAKKRKHFPCLVVMGAIRYKGLLTQNERIPGFRKCDLKFGSEVNEIMNKKIASFFPTFSVIGEQYPRDYVSEAKEELGFQQEWADHAEAIAGKLYPEVKWQLPEIRYIDKFGTDLKDDDPHFYYLGHLNARDYNGLAKNDLISNSNYFKVHNKNVIAPRVFWLAPIQYAFESIGYKLVGNVPDHGFFKRLLSHSENDNMTKIPRKPPGEPLDLNSVLWEQRALPGIYNGILVQTWIKEIEFIPPNPGEHVLRYDMNIEGQSFHGVQIYKNDQLIANHTRLYPGEFEGALTFTVEEGQENTPFIFIYHHVAKFMPVDYELGWYNDLSELDFFDMHPTIDFSRYIPDWTTVDYLNRYQKMFNLKIDIDDVEKTIALNFNVQDYLFNGKTVPIFKSLEIAEPKNIEAESYLLKYANNVDTPQFVSLHEDIERNENTKEIVTDFKFIPYNRGRHELSQRVEDREGVGLLLYDPAFHPGTVESFEGINLSMPGLGGVYDTFHKPWILFRLNAANPVLKGPFSKTELYQISKYKKILVDGQVYLVKAIDYKENSIALFDTELEVASVSF